MTEKTIIYGIANCDTVRKARKWLKENGVDYRFHDLREDGLPAGALAKWQKAVGWEVLLNRRGTSWRKLSPGEREGVNQERAMKLMTDQPLLIKRPVLVHGKVIQVGLDAAAYKKLFG